MKSPWLQVTVVFSVPTDGHYFELYGVQHKVILADISLTQRVQNYGYFLYWIAPLFLIFNFIGKLISEKESIILYLRNCFPFYFFFRYSIPDFLIIAKTILQLWASDLLVTPTDFFSCKEIRKQKILRNYGNIYQNQIRCKLDESFLCKLNWSW